MGPDSHSDTAQAGGTDEVCAAGATVAEVLRILSSGATGSILMALAGGPLRTKQLATKVPGYTPRTIYRYAGRLAELGVIDREVEKGPPSRVTQTLTDPCGTELLELIDRYADASLQRLPGGGIAAIDWAVLNLLADLWETGMVDDLSCDPLSPTELARGPHGLSYHQVNRRAGLFRAAGLLTEVPGPGPSQRLALTEKTRRAMALIAGIGRWRHHHVIAEDEEGMTAAEMATVLRTALPLLRMPEAVGSNLRIDVHHSEGKREEDTASWAEVKPDGVVHPCVTELAPLQASVGGQVKGWIPALLEAETGALEFAGDDELARACVLNLHEALWRPAGESPELVRA